MKKLKPDSNENDTRILKQWHPMFNLDSVPEVPEAELPSFPSKVVDAAEYVRSGTLKSRVRILILCVSCEWNASYTHVDDL